MEVNRERLNRHMEDRRYELGMRTWRALSSKAGIAYETLRALRAGSNPARATIRDLETALQWERGSIGAILAGGDPSPIGDLADPDVAAQHVSWDELMELIEDARASDDRLVYDALMVVKRMRDARYARPPERPAHQHGQATG